MAAFDGLSVNQVLISAMRVGSTNHRIIANNIANADTPHFNPTQLDFQTTLQRVLSGQEGVALRTTHPRHMARTSYRPDFERLAYLSKNDYNKVDLDEQLTKLSGNASDFSTYSRLLGRGFQRTRNMLNDLRQ